MPEAPKKLPLPSGPPNLARQYVDDVKLQKAERERKDKATARKAKR
jgi:hypothetical protein